jgi:CDP-6-deoxy-D-xylo-4-hexulose-3-dehydrase
MKIPLTSSGLRDQDIRAAIEVLHSGNLTMGNQVRKFEQLVAGYLRVKHFIMMNSGSSANLAIFEAMLRPTKNPAILKPGDGVLVPVIAWPTTIWPIVQLGLKPIFVDVDPDTFAIDLDKAQIALNNASQNAKAIFPIHPLGKAIDPDSLETFASKNNLALINDVCESLGSWVGTKHAGTSGLGGSFSFYFSHHITTMEGGGVATNDSDFANDLRSIRSHGWSRDRSDAKVWEENLSTNDAKFLFVSTGFNLRPMEIQAAIGVSQIADLDMFIGKRRELAKRINQSLLGSGLRLVGANTLETLQEEISHSWMLMPIQVTGENAQMRKKKVIERLHALGVETRPVLTGNFLTQPAMQRIGKNLPDVLEFGVANEISATTFLVSGHHDLDQEQIQYLCGALQKASNEYWS